MRLISSGRLKLGFPSYTVNGRWWVKPLDHQDFWDLGFFIGLLFRLGIRIEGLKLLKSLEERSYPLNHNLGFLFYHAFVPAYMETDAPRLKRRIVYEAERMASLFDESLGFIPMDYPHNDKIAIDTLASLEFLWWVSHELGRSHLGEIAERHVLSSIRLLLRGDGSTVHILSMRDGPLSGQGLSPSSCWSRGAAWASLGFLRAYEVTKAEIFKLSCEKVLRFAMRMVGEDGVPPWDFSDPRGVKDTSSGAIFLKVLSSFDGEFSRWRERLRSSLKFNYLSEDEGWEGLLKGGCYHYHLRKGVNESLIWGDYFASYILSDVI